ncbi:unnamed protein product [Alternaria alternata]
MSSKATSEDENHSNSDPLSSPANISSITSALRSRLECSPIVVPNSSWLNRAADVYPDRKNETLPGGPENVVVHGSWYRNFTIKWIVGPGATAEISGAELNTTYQNNGDTFGNASEELLYFTEEPTMSIMNCAPIIEVANASVIVARSSGNVLDFVLLSDTQPDQNAWEYAWDIVYPEPTRNDADGNVR